MKRKGLCISVCAAMLVMGSYPMQAESFAGREDEMNKKCSAIKDTATQKQCIAYKEYLKDKSKNLLSEIDDIKKQLNDVKGSMETLGEKLKTNNSEVAKINNEISSVQNSIEKTQKSIAAMNQQIKEKEQDIKDRDAKMRERLVEMQPYTGSNNFIDFLMGSSDFADLLRRSEILGQLNAYESSQIQALNKEKTKLKENKKLVEDQKELLVVQKQGLQDQKAKAEALKQVNEKLMNAYRTQEDQLLDQKIQAQMAQTSIPKIDTSLAASFDEETTKPNNNNKPSQGNSSNENNEGGNTNGGGNDNGGGSSSNSGSSDNQPSGNTGGGTQSSTGFVTPIVGNWHYSAGTWAYPSGNVHRGMDFGTYQAQGLRVVAPASGIVIWTHGGCASPSGNNYPNSCGVPQTTGNNLTMIARVNGTVYAFSFYHLSGFAVSSGTTVKQGQTIAYTGNSGNSTGPHCHVEMIKVGNMTLTEALNRFNNSGDLSFGVGWRSDPKACGSAPCRLRPENYFL